MLAGAQWALFSSSRTRPHFYMKALITGGAGFIGSHLAQALCRRGAQVVVLDDLSSGGPQNLAWRSAGDDLEHVAGDARDEALLAKLVAGCDWVFHQAAVASVPQSVQQPLETNQTNLDATLKLLIAARDAGVRRFLFASSSAIYGESEVMSKHESLPTQPITPYGLQKYASERYCQLFHQLYGLPTVALRYFNVFGPRQSFNSPYAGVIARFCTAMLRGEAPVIYGDGSQSRDFVFIDNIVGRQIWPPLRPRRSRWRAVSSMAAPAPAFPFCNSSPTSIPSPGRPSSPALNPVVLVTSATPRPT